MAKGFNKGPQMGGGGMMAQLQKMQQQFTNMQLWYKAMNKTEPVYTELLNRSQKKNNPTRCPSWARHSKWRWDRMAGRGST